MSRIRKETPSEKKISMHLNLYLAVVRRAILLSCGKKQKTRIQKRKRKKKTMTKKQEEWKRTKERKGEEKEEE